VVASVHSFDHLSKSLFQRSCCNWPLRSSAENRGNDREELNGIEQHQLLIVFTAGSRITEQKRSASFAELLLEVFCHDAGDWWVLCDFGRCQQRNTVGDNAICKWNMRCVWLKYRACICGGCWLLWLARCWLFRCLWPTVFASTRGLVSAAKRSATARFALFWLGRAVLMIKLS
jgi:hypothetical protein